MIPSSSTPSSFPTYSSWTASGYRNNSQCDMILNDDRSDPESASYHPISSDPTTSSTVYADGAPLVFENDPHFNTSTDYALAHSACYSTEPIETPALDHSQQGIYDYHQQQQSCSSSGASMPPTPPGPPVPDSYFSLYQTTTTATSMHTPTYPCPVEFSSSHPIPNNNMIMMASPMNQLNDNFSYHHLAQQHRHRRQHHHNSKNFKHRKAKRSEKIKEKKKCSNCGATKTPTWRRGPITKLLLCNACGLYEKVSQKRRVVIVQVDGKTKISRAALNHQQQQREADQPQGEDETTRMCSQCHTLDAKRWYEQPPQGQKLDDKKTKCTFICDRCLRSTTILSTKM